MVPLTTVSEREWGGRVSVDVSEKEPREVQRILLGWRWYNTIHVGLCFISAIPDSWIGETFHHLDDNERSLRA